MRSVKGRIGIFGGTFNPVHMGHLIAAEDVRYKMKLDKILFIPSNIPPHKSTKGLISAEDRLNMVKLAIEGNPFFECSDIEIKRGGKSYTIDTVKEVKNINKAEYFFILGGEAFLSFHNWKNPEGILREIDLIVISRPFGAVSSHDLENYLLDLEEILEGFRYVDSEVFGDRGDIVRFVVTVGDLERNIYYVKVVSVDISSTMVRKRIKKGMPFRYLIPESVYDYIVRRGLYLHGSGG